MSSEAMTGPMPAITDAARRRDMARELRDWIAASDLVPLSCRQLALRVAELLEKDAHASDGLPPTDHTPIRERLTALVEDFARRG